MIQTALFYLFSGTLIGSALMVITGRNAVHSVLFLILAFLNAAGLFLLAGAEFLAFILIIVYAGALAVLFLFVVMMLDIPLRSFSQGITPYTFSACGAATILAGELIVAGIVWNPPAHSTSALEHPVVESLSNTHSLGQILYTDYFFPFQLSGIILLVAIIGAIILTLRTLPDIRPQNYGAHLKRSPANSLEIIKGTPQILQAHLEDQLS
jgi:NADH-quinone oxidoreductase subunit J